jgi:hypothetical protein
LDALRAIIVAKNPAFEQTWDVTSGTVVYRGEDD